MEPFRLDEASGGHLPRSSVQNRATFEVVWGCSGPVHLSSEFPKMEILRSLWAISSRVWPSLLWRGFFLYVLSEFLLPQLVSVVSHSFAVHLWESDFVPCNPPLGGRIQELDPPLLSRLFSRLNKHSLLSPFSKVMCCSPLNHSDGLPLDMVQFVSGILVLGSPKRCSCKCWIRGRTASLDLLAALQQPSMWPALPLQRHSPDHVQRVVEAPPVLAALPVLPEELVFLHGSTPVTPDLWSSLFIDNHTITSFTKLKKQNTVPFDTPCLERPSVLFIILLLSFSPVPIWILAGTSLMQMRSPISQISSYCSVVCFSLSFFLSFFLPES